MKRILLTSILAAGFAAPALAQMSGPMSCEEFSAMDADGQMEAVESMHGAQAEDDMGGDAMTEGGSDSSTESQSAGSEDQMAAAQEACDAHPDMTVSEAMEAEKG